MCIDKSKRAYLLEVNLYNGRNAEELKMFIANVTAKDS